MSKAQVSSGFNYIFALIIGGVVFMFFIGFAYQFMGFANKLSAGELVNALNDEFSAFSGSESAEKSLELTKKAEFKVFEGQLISDGLGKDIDHIIYSPFEVNGKELFIATKALEMPFKVGNAFYIADGRTIYILVYDSDTQEVVEDLVSSYNAIPSSFPTGVVSVKDLDDLETISAMNSEYEVTRFVFFTKADAYVESISENFEDYEIIEVSSSLEDYSSGEIVFSEGVESVYIGYPMLIGGMVADSSAYEYNFEKVFEKVSRVTKVYYDKSRFLGIRLPECDYSRVQMALNGLDSADKISYSNYLSKMEVVEDENSKLGGDCPEVF